MTKPTTPAHPSGQADHSDQADRGQVSQVRTDRSTADRSTADRSTADRSTADRSTADRGQVSQVSRGTMLVAAGLLALEGLLFFVPFAILGTAIGWPASLDDPAAVALPRLLAEEPAVRLGYLTYLAYSVLFLPVAVWATRVLTGGRHSLLARLAVAFAAVSALARSIGILRWLTVMPVLAVAWRDAPDDATRTALAVQYEALNSYGGGIGELLGVSLFAALWLACTVIAARHSGQTPRWLLAAGALTTVALASPLVELAGVDPGATITIGTTAVQLWFLAAAVALLLRARSTPPAATRTP